MLQITFTTQNLLVSSTAILPFSSLHTHSHSHIHMCLCIPSVYKCVCNDEDIHLQIQLHLTGCLFFYTQDGGSTELGHQFKVQRVIKPSTLLCVCMLVEKSFGKIQASVNVSAY